MDRQTRWTNRAQKPSSVLFNSATWEGILYITPTDTHQTSHFSLQSGGEVCVCACLRFCVHVCV